MTKTIKVNEIHYCARCHQDHKNLEFQELTYSTDLYDTEGDGPYTHWTACPTNGEPILLWSD